MDSGFYAACSGLAAKTRQLEATAHNIANVSTTAFKSRQVAFQSILAKTGSSLAPLNQALNEYGVIADPTLNTAAGLLERTGNDLDLAIEGSAYFVVQTAAGTGYSRNGKLHMSTQGQLLNANGNAVLSEQGSIRIPPGTKISISPDGTISAGGALVGRLRLVEFGSDAKLKETQPGVFISDSKPIAARASVVRQGSLEASNVNGIEAAVDLIAIQRHAEMLERAMSIFHSEFNRIATSELARV